MTPISDNEWAMLTAECVRDLDKSFPVVGDFHGANSIAFYGYDKMKQLFKTDYKQYKDRYRDTSKRVGLGLLYGGSYRVVEAPNESEQRRLYTNFFSTLKGFSKHLSEAEPKAKKDLYTTNIFGCRVWLKDFNHKDFKIASTVRRRFLNAPIQSAGSQALLTAMYRIVKFSETTRTNKFANDNIHDQYYNRIVTASQDQANDPAFTEALNALQDGNILLCIKQDDELTQQWDRLLAIDTDFITKWGLNVYF